MIADSHLAFADQISFGARGAQCLKLARMHRLVQFSVYEKNNRYLLFEI